MSDDLRTVARYARPAEAAIARNSLEAAGISAWIADELTLTADPFLSGAVNFIKVQVRAGDLERAVEVLAEVPGPVAPDAHEHDGDPDGPDAGDGPDEFPPETPGQRRVRFAYRAALMGVLVCPPLLHIYWLVQLLVVAATHPDLGPRANRQFYIAFLIDLAVIATAALIVLQILG
jgi:Putative prokaryotic signal transducing protein